MPRWSSWLGYHLYTVGIAGSNPARDIIFLINNKLYNYIFYLNSKYITINLLYGIVFFVVFLTKIFFIVILKNTDNITFNQKRKKSLEKNQIYNY